LDRDGYSREVSSHPCGTSILVAKPSEVRALVALRSAVAQEMTRKFGEGHWSARPSQADVLRQLRASYVLVARRGAEIIGMVRLVRPLPGAIDSSAFTPVEKPLYVLGLAVAPECRGQAIGRRLLDAAKDRARSCGAQALWLDAYEHEAGAGPFYLKCGFRKVGGTQYREVPLVYFEWLAAC
jgi:ribosomal protein S18 acetylase RimI-like enzyme